MICRYLSVVLNMILYRIDNGKAQNYKIKRNIFFHESWGIYRSSRDTTPSEERWRSPTLIASVEITVFVWSSSRRSACYGRWCMFSNVSQSWRCNSWRGYYYLVICHNLVLIFSCRVIRSMCDTSISSHLVHSHSQWSSLSNALIATEWCALPMTI